MARDEWERETDTQNQQKIKISIATESQDRPQTTQNPKRTETLDWHRHRKPMATETQDKNRHQKPNASEGRERGLSGTEERETYCRKEEVCWERTKEIVEKRTHLSLLLHVLTERNEKTMQTANLEVAVGKQMKGKWAEEEEKDGKKYMYRFFKEYVV